MFGLSLSYPLPEPSYYYNLSKSPSAVSDDTSAMPMYTLKNLLNEPDEFYGNLYTVDWFMKPPAWKHLPWVIYQEFVEATELKTGVWHITKLLANSDRTIFRTSEGASYGNFNVFVSTPKGRTFSTDGYVYAQAPGRQYKISLFSGITKISAFEDERVDGTISLKIPSSFYDTNESGEFIDTDTDFYIVFFPVLDESNLHGFGEYLVPKFEAGIKDVGWNLPNYEVKVVDDTHLVCEQQMLTVSDAAYNPEVYYRDESLIVISPFVVNLKSSQPYGYLVSYTYNTPDKYQDVVEQNYLGDGSPFVSYGVAFVPLGGSKFNESADYLLNYFAPLNLLLPGDTIQLLPYKYERIAFLQAPEGQSIGMEGPIGLNNSVTTISKFSFASGVRTGLLCAKTGVKTGEGLVSGIFIDTTNNSAPVLTTGLPEGSRAFVNGRREDALTDSDVAGFVFVGATVCPQIPSKSETNGYLYLACVNADLDISYFSGEFYSAVGFPAPLTPFQINAAMKKYNITAEPTKYNSNFNTDSYVQAY